MGFFSGAKKVVKPLVDFPRWMDTPTLANNAKMIAGLAKRIFTAPKATRTETFEEAMSRLNLTETDIQRRKKEFLRLICIFGLLSILLYAYSFYLLSHSYIRGGILALIVSTIALMRVFRFHFWYFQIKKRKLGCTFKEWLQGLLGKTQ